MLHWYNVFNILRRFPEFAKKQFENCTRFIVFEVFEQFFLTIVLKCWPWDSYTSSSMIKFIVSRSGHIKISRCVKYFKLNDIAASKYKRFARQEKKLLFRPYIKLIKFINLLTLTTKSPHSTNANKYFNLFLFFFSTKRSVLCPLILWMTLTMIWKRNTKKARRL